MEKQRQRSTDTATEKIASNEGHPGAWPSSTPCNASAPCVLLVDRDISFLTLVSRRLSKGGYRVITAQSAAEALQRLIWQYFDVVITSDRLEGISGSQLASHLKSLPTIPRGSAVPVVMLSEDDEQPSQTPGPADEHCSFQQLPKLPSIIADLLHGKRVSE